jgi:hypothetical protein
MIYLFIYCEDIVVSTAEVTMWFGERWEAIKFEFLRIWTEALDNFCKVFSNNKVSKTEQSVTRPGFEPVTFECWSIELPLCQLQGMSITI